MKEYKVFINQEEPYSEPVRYVLELIANNQQVKFHYIPEKDNADMFFHADGRNPNLPLAAAFYQKLIIGKRYSHTEYFSTDCKVKDNDGKVDDIATIFYMLNCFQEYSEDENEFDRFGRYLYQRSYQQVFDAIEENLVQKAINEFCLSHLKDHSLRQIKSRVFVSHDIDTVYGALFQDGYWALKHKRLDVILQLIFNALLLKPDWKNMDMIMKINDDYSIKSTFFWLAKKGKGSKGIMNADYKCHNLKQMMIKIDAGGFYNGIHKSCNATSLREELDQFPINVKFNRFHFLRYRLPELWDQIADSPIQADFSLGFAERFGFRNNYGLPFKPYDLKNKRSYSFIEVPLNAMDSTFSRYMKIPAVNTATEIINFFEKNKFNCILSLLWHNTYFSNYKYRGYLQEYKKVLGYLYESKIDHVTPPAIIKEFNYGA
jgi:hypothetical protein